MKKTRPRKSAQLWRLAFDAFVFGQPGQFPSLSYENSPVLIGFVDEARGTLARLSAYGMTLALLAILRSRALERAARCDGDGALHQGGWSQVERPVRAFAVSQANFARQDRDLRGLSASRGRPQGYPPLERRRRQAPVAELEIYRPGEEPEQVGSRPVPCDQDGSAGPRELRSRRNDRQQVRPGHAAPPVGGSAEAARACLRFYQAYR